MIGEHSRTTGIGQMAVYIAVKTKQCMSKTKGMQRFNVRALH